MPIRPPHRPPLRPRRASHAASDDPPGRALLWALRLLLEQGGLQVAVGDHGPRGRGFFTPRMQRFLGLDLDLPSWDEFDDVAPVLDFRALRPALRQRLAELEEAPQRTALPPALAANIDQLAGPLRLGPAESALLAFTVLLKTVDELRDCAELLGELSRARVHALLAKLLHLPENAVAAALSKSGTLAQSGLLRLEPGARQDLPDKLDLISDAFAERMTCDESSPLELLRDTVSICPPATLDWADFEHAEADLGLLRRYLAHALEHARPGVNILIHGPSGTGKTETARLLAAHRDALLFEVSSEDDAGDPIDGKARMRAHRAAQLLLANSRAILLFDEAEDIFGRGGWRALFGGGEGDAQQRKAWVNKALETNPAPTLWLSNAIAGIDPAFLRRFDMVIEMPIPPRGQRERIAARAAAGMLPAASLRRLSQCEHLAPALISRAVDVIRCIREDLPEAEIPLAVERLLDNALRAQGRPRLAKNASPAERYDPALTNADGDLDALATGLLRAGRGRLCLHGPSGTGKTAYAHWLAQRLERPLLTRRASDLLDMWVGSSERLIAQAFREAESEGAVLLFDEVDGFLRDRRGAQHRWELTQVNELLTGMESFDGIFIASTNLMHELDQAALRRFDLKIRFDYLHPEQAGELLLRACARLTLPAPEDEAMNRLASLGNLTPGDFAAVERRNDFHPLKSPDALVHALEAECRLKETPGRSIGFLR